MENIIRIEYCTAWGYLAKAVSLTDEILGKYKNAITKLELIPSTGGVYEFTFNDELIFSKKELNRYPEDGEIIKLIDERIK